jgi:hypothetical protein
MKLTAGNAPAVVDQPFTIAWQAGTGATCTSSGGSWNTPVNSLPASGSKAITESVAATYTYSLTCSYGSGGTSQAQRSWSSLACHRQWRLRGSVVISSVRSALRRGNGAAVVLGGHCAQVWAAPWHLSGLSSRVIEEI